MRRLDATYNSAQSKYDFTAFEEFDQTYGTDARRIRGIGLWNNTHTPYIRWSGSQWELWINANGTLSQITDFTEENTDPNVSPYNVTVGPSHYEHVDNDTNEARSNFTYLSHDGKVLAKRGDNSTSSSNIIALASGAPMHSRGVCPVL